MALSKHEIKKDPLWDAIVLGQTSLVPKTHIDLWKKLGVMHFLSPGAMHVSAILIWFNFKRLKIYLPWVCFTILLFFLFHHQKNYFPLERTLFFVWLKSLQFPIKFSFLATILFDVLILNTTTSPLSFLYSLWFWFIIIYAPSGIHRYNFLFLAQMALMSINGQAAYLLLYLVSPLLNLCLGLIYPLLLIFYLIPINAISDFSLLEFCEKIFLWIFDAIKLSATLNELWVISMGFIQLIWSLKPSRALMMTIVFNATELNSLKGNQASLLLNETKVFNKTYYQFEATNKKIN